MWQPAREVPRAQRGPALLVLVLLLLLDQPLLGAVPRRSALVAARQRQGELPQQTLLLQGSLNLPHPHRPTQIRPWSKNDIVGVLLDLATGELRYWLNGAECGVAFEGIGRDDANGALLRLL